VEFAHDLLSTRRGSVIVGAISAVLAAALLLLYLSNYRSSVGGSSKPMTVLVAKKFIPEGTPGEVIGTSGQFEVSTVPASALKKGAFADPASLRGRAAVRDIYAGQQLSAADFVSASENTVVGKLVGDDRAISVPLDAAHGLVGQLQAGDHVDVFGLIQIDGPRGKMSALKLIAQDALVLQSPSRASGSTGTSNVVLRASGNHAAEIAFAVDQGNVWLVLRPPVGARPSGLGVVTANSILLDRTQSRR
jgi:Flp pilus assembly protein CpaB